MPFKVRCQRVQKILAREKLEALLVTKAANRYYLSGFRGTSGYLLITSDNIFLLTDFRYVEQAKQQAPDCEIVDYGKDWFAVLSELLQTNKVKQIGFEQEQMSYGQFQRLENKVKDVIFIGAENLIEELREVKDTLELELIKNAAFIADMAFQRLLEVIEPGIREVEVAAELEYAMRRLGSEGTAFETIIASGIRSAFPHGIASAKKIETGDLVVIDFGATYQGYCSDMTRTLVIGAATSKQKEIYNLVLEAQLAGLAKVKADLPCQEVDDVSRQIIINNGYGDYFGHSLGHGVGLDVHENPRLAAGNTLPLKKGTVVTIEPGIYLEDWGGVRIEDMVAVTYNGCEILTKTSKELVEL